MNILYGLATPDEGEILLDGAGRRRSTGPSDAIARGISMVHQHFMLVPVLTVADNILLGEETMANPIFLDRKEAHRRIVELGKRFGFEIDPEAKVERLSVGWQQRVEILKALYREARILVLDEPTAVLTPQETKEIFAVLRRLAAEGHSIIFISHKLYEVLEIADRITVIRRGKVVGHADPVRDQRGRPGRADGRPRRPARRRPRRVAPGRARCSSVEDLRVADDRGHEAVKGVSVRGPGRRDPRHRRRRRQRPGRARRGAHRPAQADRRARSTSHGQDVTGAGPRDLQRAGMSFVPGDRQRFGLVLELPARGQPRPDPVRRGALRPRHRSATTAAIARVGQAGDRRVRHPDAVADASTPARCRAATSRRRSSPASSAASSTALVLDQPTRGLDVGSIEFIHRQVIAKRDAGAAILLVSAELDEVLELSDRIAVMYRGEIVALVDGPTAEREEIGLLMATGRRDRGWRRRRDGLDDRRPSRRHGGAEPPPGDDATDAPRGPSGRCLARSSLDPDRLDPPGAAARRGPDHRCRASPSEGSINLLLPLVAYESLLQGATGLSFLDVDGGTISFAISIDPEQRTRR